jgi:F-type H+-transporting ATPase subunit delta
MAVAHRIYARALFDAAKERNALPRVRDEFAGFVEALESSGELRNLLRNPQIDARAKRAGIDAVFGESDPVFLNFLRVSADKRRLGEVEEIHREFERLVAEDERVLKVDLVTAHELSDAEAAEIIGKIERASGRRVDATRSVDPSLIGGIVLQAGSFRADASVRGRLDSLRHELATRS